MDGQDQAEAVEVAGVIAGRDNMVSFRRRMLLRAYLTRAESPTGMQLTRSFTATIKGFNEEFGQACRTWKDVAVTARKIMSRWDGQSK